MRQLRLLFSLLLLISCGNSEDYEQTYDQISAPLNAYCTANVVGKGSVDVENVYLPGVVRCENGNAPLEALKAQAVAARSYLYYKLNTSGSIVDSQADQVYSCGVQPSAIHKQAVSETAGQVLQYNNVQVAAFYVAGAVPSTSNCVALSSDNDYSNTEHYVTYNWGNSGANLEQTTLGWVNPGNYANRGCKSQNGASCLANKGWGYQDILKYYYGMDINLVYAEGSCIGNNCECSGNETETQACGQCGQRTRTCDGCSWGSWSSCQNQGTCSPGASESQGCGSCGSQTRTCSSQCQWGSWGSCAGTGSCSPGQTQTESCGNCGTRTRTCSGQCAWGSWSSCQGEGACSPGGVQEEGCGNCGVRTRTCTASCSWPSWSSCTAEGECAPGAIDSSACGDCGVTERVCGADCNWGAESACTSISEDSGAPCTLDLNGPCSEGAWKCIDGVSVCEPSYLPTPEVCDGIDNDCNGLVDEGALGVGETPYAAERIALDAPETLIAGAFTTARVTFKNIGTEAWPDGAMWLVADGDEATGKSLFYDEDTWATETMVAPLDGLVEAGEFVSFNIPLRAPDKAGETITETFRLAEQSQGTLSCTTPYVTLSIEVTDSVQPEPVTDADAGSAPRGDDILTPQDANSARADAQGRLPADMRTDSPSGCSSGSDDQAPSGVFLLLLCGLGLLVPRRQRSH